MEMVMRSLTCQLLITAIILSRTSLAGTPSANAVDVLSWMFEKAAGESDSQRKSYVDSHFDIDIIAASIRTEAARRLPHGLVSDQAARDFIYHVTTQAAGGPAEVRISSTFTNSHAKLSSIVIQFVTLSKGQNFDVNEWQDLRSLYRLDPIAAREFFARERPSIPPSALRSADTLIAYLENSMHQGEPVAHEYEFILDNLTGRILDMKVLWRVDQPRRSLFMKFVDNIETYLHSEANRANGDVLSK